MTLTRRRIATVLSCLLLLAAAALMPQEWYDALPRGEKRGPLPIRGTTLLQILLVIQAAVLAVVGFSTWRWSALPDSSRLPEFTNRAEPDDLPSRQATISLVAITVLALALRLYRVNADLWIDEIITINRFAHESLGFIIGSYRTSNNHLLMSVMVKYSILLFGEHEWSVRLPALLLGTATIPAVYRISRFAMSRRASLGAALLLAVSYHHIFFSQNARGYIVYVFFAVAAAIALVNALRDDRMRDWILFGAATFFGALSLLNTVFVVASQLLVAAIAVFLVARRGGEIAPLVKRLTVVFFVTGFLCLQVYAIVLPDAFVLINYAYKHEGTGFKPTSNDFGTDVVRGITDGFGSRAIYAAIPFLFVAGAGFLVLLQRQWAVALLLVMPGVITAATLLARGLTFSPRFFLLWLPLTAVTAAATIDALSQWLRSVVPARRHALATAITLVLALTSAWSLRRYYEIPKQPYVAVVKHLTQNRQPEDMIFTVAPSGVGIRYYSRRLSPELLPYLRDIETDSALKQEMIDRGNRRIILVTTLDRGRSLERPKLTKALRELFKKDTSFAATIGNGEVHLWSEKNPPPR